MATDISLIYTTAAGDNAIVTTVATTRSLRHEQAAATLDAMVPGDLVVLQGNLSADVTRRIIEAVRQRGLMIALNPSPMSAWCEGLLPMAHIVFVNAGEAMALTGKSGPAAVHSMLAVGPGQVVLTLGADGALLGTRSAQSVKKGIRRGHIGDSDIGQHRGRVITVPAAAASTVDTTGAGDTYLAVALASASRRCTGLDERALQAAARAAAITVGRHGTRSAFPSTAELQSILGVD
jgi:ribokinase